MAYFSVHNHSHYSNIRLIDSINRPEEIIKHANNIGLKGIVLSDHECLSGHVKFIQAYKKMEENNELSDDFKIGLGNEIYLVKEDSLEELKENYTNRNPETKFYHFLLIAKNEEGYQQLRILSSMAWENMFKTGRMERVPTFKSNLKKVIKQGDVIATSACLGGFVGQKLLRIREGLEGGNKESVNLHQKELLEFITFCIDVFGKEDFYLEMQPSVNEEQKYVNRQIINLSEKLGLKYIVATDAHYLKKEDREAHRVYLQSQDGEREVDDFYDATYVFSEAELYEALNDHLTKEEIETAMNNTMKIHRDIEFFDLFHRTIIPHPEIPKFEQRHLFKKVYEDYEYIKKFAYSDHEVDRYFLHLIEKGVEEKIAKRKDFGKEYLHKTLERINTELRELWLISIRLEDRMSSYYVLTQEVIDVIWNEGDSLTGVARGSASGFLVNFLVGITQINPMDYDLPHFRHLTAERPELPDIDIDTQQNRRQTILQALRDKYGEKRVLNIATFSTEGSKSALLSAGRGLGIDIDEVQYLTTLIPVERGFNWTLSDCFFGNRELGRKPVKELVNAVNKYEGLQEISLRIEGLVKAKSVHASGEIYRPQSIGEPRNLGCIFNA